jgi:hypothetical protein
MLFVELNVLHVHVGYVPLWLILFFCALALPESCLFSWMLDAVYMAQQMYIHAFSHTHMNTNT